MSRLVRYLDMIDQQVRSPSTPISGFFRELVQDLDSRISTAEDGVEAFKSVRHDLSALALAYLAETLQPEFDRVRVAADLGQLFEARSLSPLVVATGSQQLVVRDEDKGRFSAPGYLLIRKVGADGVWMLGQKVAYDRPSGLLEVLVDRVGSPGAAGSEWDLSAAPADAVPNAADGDYSADEIVVSPTVLGQNRVQAVLAALVTALGLKAPLTDAGLLGAPTAPTAVPGTNSTQIANTAFVQAAIAGLLNSAPGALDTLDELAAALGDDANFAATVTMALSNKQPLAANLTTLAALAAVSNLSTLANLGSVVNLSTLAGLGSVANLSTVAGLASIANLSALAGLTGAADKGVRFTGAGAMTVFDLTAFGRTLTGLANAAALRGAAEISHGNYTPTVDGVTNVTGTPTVHAAKYERTGSRVKATVWFSVTPTAGSSISTTVRISLPIASALTGGSDALGQITTATTGATGGDCYGEAGGNVIARFRAGGTGVHICTASFVYDII